MQYGVWTILGLVAGGVLLAYARSKGSHHESRILAIALVVVAIVYVGFALVWGNTTWVIIEIAGVPVFGLFARLARHSYRWLAAGWTLHPVWDVGLHCWGPGSGIAPEWYVIACVSFDLLVAAYVVAHGFRQRKITG